MQINKLNERVVVLQEQEIIDILVDLCTIDHPLSKVVGARGVATMLALMFREQTHEELKAWMDNAVKEHASHCEDPETCHASIISRACQKLLGAMRTSHVAAVVEEPKIGG